MGQGQETFGLVLRAEASVRGPEGGSWLGDKDLGCGVGKEARHKGDGEVRAAHI